MIKEYLDINYKVIHDTIVELPCNPKWTKYIIDEISDIFSLDPNTTETIVKEWAFKNGFDDESWNYAYTQQRKTLYTSEDLIEFLDLENKPFLKYYSQNNRLDFNMLMYFEASRNSAFDLFNCQDYSGPIVYNMIHNNDEIRRALVFLTKLRYEKEEYKKTNNFWQRWIKTEEYDKISRKNSEK